MPFISDAQIARLQTSYASMQNKMASARAKAEEKAGEIKQTLEIVGAAGGMGFLRGKFEEPDGSFNIPGTTIDIEMVAGLGLVGAGDAPVGDGAVVARIEVGPAPGLGRPPPRTGDPGWPWWVRALASPLPVGVEPSAGRPDSTTLCGVPGRSIRPTSSGRRGSARSASSRPSAPLSSSAAFASSVSICISRAYLSETRTNTSPKVRSRGPPLIATSTTSPGRTPKASASAVVMWM